MKKGYLICSLSECHHCRDLMEFLRKNYDSSISDTVDFSDGTVKIIHDLTTIKRLGVSGVPFIFVIELDSNNKGVPNLNKSISVSEFKEIIKRLKK